jgi:hypothetical protein
LNILDRRIRGVGAFENLEYLALDARGFFPWVAGVH